MLGGWLSSKEESAVASTTGIAVKDTLLGSAVDVLLGGSRDLMQG